MISEVVVPGTYLHLRAAKSKQNLKKRKSAKMPGSRQRRRTKARAEALRRLEEIIAGCSSMEKEALEAQLQEDAISAEPLDEEPLGEKALEEVATRDQVYSLTNGHFHTPPTWQPPAERRCLTSDTWIGVKSSAGSSSARQCKVKGYQRGISEAVFHSEFHR